MKITEVHDLLEKTFPGSTWAYGTPGAGITQSHEVTHKIGTFEIKVLAVGDPPTRIFLVQFTQMIQNKRVEILRAKLSTADEVTAAVEWIEEYLRGLHIAILVAFKDRL